MICSFLSMIRSTWLDCFCDEPRLNRKVTGFLSDLGVCLSIIWRDNVSHCNLSHWQDPGDEFSDLLSSHGGREWNDSWSCWSFVEGSKMLASFSVFLILTLSYPYIHIYINIVYIYIYKSKTCWAQRIITIWWCFNHPYKFTLTEVSVSELTKSASFN